MSDATQVPDWAQPVTPLQQWLHRNMTAAGAPEWARRPWLGFSYPWHELKRQTPPTKFTEHVFGAGDFLGDMFTAPGRLATDIGDYFTKPSAPGEPPKPPLVPATREQIAALGTPREGPRTLSLDPGVRKPFEIGVQIPRSPAEDYPAPPPVAVPNYPEAPTLPKPDYSAAREWMRQAQPVAERADPNSMLVSVLGGMAAGAAQPITGRGQIGMLLARIGAGAAAGRQAHMQSESERERRNQVAQTGYALRQAGFEGDVAAKNAEIDLRQAEINYRRSFEIAQHMASAINQQRGQQYGHQVKKWELGKQHEERYGPKVSFHGDNVVTGQREGDQYKYTVTPTKGSLDDIVKGLDIEQKGLNILKSRKELGEPAGGGKGGPSRQLASETTDALKTRVQGYGNTPYAHGISGLVERVVDSEIWKNLPATSALKQTRDALVEKDKNLKNLFNVASVPGASLEARLQFKAAFTEALFDAMMGNDKLAGTIAAELGVK